MTLKEPTANDLIPELLDKLSNYTDKFKDRIKVDSIFNEFDESARGELNKFIKMSQTRYKSVKSGNSLQNLYNNQKSKYDKLTNNILKDVFYNTNEIETENKKLFKKPDKKNNQELIDLRQQIILKTKNYSKSELRNRERLDKILARKKANKETPNFFSRLDFIYEPKSIKRKSPKKIQEVEKEESEDDENDYIEPLEEQKNFFENIMNEDSKQFNDNLQEYKDYLSYLKATYKDGDSLKKNKNETNEKFQFLTENVKLLSYKEEENLDLKPKKKEEPRIDVRKLMKYTKRGRRSAKYFSSRHYNSNRLNKKKEINNLKNKRPKTSHKINFSPYDKLYNNYNSDMDLLNDNKSQNNTFNLSSTIGFSNFKNTIKTVKNEAQKSKLLDNNFDKKWDTMEEFFKNNNLQKLSRPETAKAIFNNNIIDFDDNSWRKKKRNITSALSKNSTLNNKEEINEDNRNFLKEIRNFSQKSKLINNPKISIYLRPKGGFKNKKVKKGIFKTNDQYTYKGKELTEKELAKQMMKKRENELEDEVCEKIRTNLNNEDEGEDIQLNYQVNGEKIKVNSQFDPYNEFLEFKNIIKQREEEIKRKNMEELRLKNLKNVNKKIKKIRTENLDMRTNAFMNKFGQKKNDINENKDINIIFKEKL